MFNTFKQYKNICTNFKQTFKTDFFRSFDKESFKIEGTNKDAEIKQHREIFSEMEAYFKQFTYLYKNHIYADPNSYCANKAIYGTLFSYFRSFFSLKSNKDLGVSFIVRKEFLAIEAGFQIKGLSDLDKKLFNEIIIHLLAKENLFFLSKFNFDLLYTYIGKEDAEIPLEKGLAFYQENKEKDGVFQLRWKLPRQALEKYQHPLAIEVIMVNVVDEILEFLNCVQDMIPSFMRSHTTPNAGKKIFPD